MTAAVPRTGLPVTILVALRRIVGDVHVIDDPERLTAFDTDWTGRFPGRASVAVRPADAAQVAAIVQLCRTNGLAVVPQGGNTGLVGGGVARDGEVLVSLVRLDQIGEVDVDAAQVSAGAGVTLRALQEHVAAYGLEVGTDFSARESATIGGIVATNAGGERVLRHGMVRSQVAGMEVVLADGSVVRRMTGLVKDNCGYDVPGLLVGSEGTLGIITAVRLRLFARLAHHATALIATASISDALRALTALRGRIEGVEAADFFTDAGLALVREALGLAPPFAQPYAVNLLVDVASSRPCEDELLQALSDTPSVQDAAVAASPADRRRLWRYREAHTEVLRMHGQALKLDLAVPLSHLEQFLVWAHEQVRQTGPEAAPVVFGHLAEGNVHFNVLDVPAEAEAGLTERILRRVGELEGSISAEHGVGTYKAPWLPLSRSREEVAAMIAIKSALDPAGTLNPGVILQRSGAVLPARRD